MSARVWVFVGFALAASGCINKGDTNIGDRDKSSNDDDKAEERDAAPPNEDTSSAATSGDSDDPSADDVTSSHDDATSDDDVLPNEPTSDDGAATSDATTSPTSGADTSDDEPSTADEPSTELPTDPCDPDPCRNEGICAPLDGDFECDCGDTGYTGKRCERVGYVQLAAGGSNTCAVMADHTLKCWGNGFPDLSTKPDFTKISLGTAGACALRLDQTIECFGQGGPAAREGYFTDVAVGGGNNACAIDTERKLVCWGDEAGLKTYPDDETIEFTHVDVSSLHACALDTNDNVTCWHRDLTQMPDLSGVFQQIDLDPNAIAACGITLDHELICAGLESPINTEEDDEDGDKYLQVAMGWGHVCAITEDNFVKCWGADQGGSTKPPPYTFSQIACAGSQCCGLRLTNAEVECWGTNLYGISPED